MMSNISFHSRCKIWKKFHARLCGDDSIVRTCVILFKNEIIIIRFFFHYKSSWQNWKRRRQETYPRPFDSKVPAPPLKKRFFWGGDLYHQIIFSILAIRPWFKIWKILKVSFWSICFILVNTWSTPEDFTANEIWRYRKMAKKCIFSEIKNFPILLNQNLGVFSMDNVFSDVSEIGDD